MVTPQADLTRLLFGSVELELLLLQPEAELAVGREVISTRPCVFFYTYHVDNPCKNIQRGAHNYDFIADGQAELTVWGGAASGPVGSDNRAPHCCAPSAPFSFVSGVPVVMEAESVKWHDGPRLGG